jgi:hypothetical protein
LVFDFLIFFEKFLETVYKVLRNSFSFLWSPDQPFRRYPVQPKIVHPQTQTDTDRQNDARI